MSVFDLWILIFDIINHPLKTCYDITRSMSRVSQVEIRRTVLTVVSSAIAGMFAGAAAGWVVSGWYGDMMAPNALPPISATGTQPGTTNGGEITVIPVDRSPLPSVIPAPFRERRSSGVAGVYRAGVGALLTDDRLISQAVVVTSDGWFVVPGEAVAGIRISDLLLWHDGGVATATRAVRDTGSGVVFLKTPLSGLRAPAFARASDVSVGVAAWVERRAGQFEPVAVSALGEPLESLDGASSETTMRRGTLTGVSVAGDLGAPVWSGNGALIGLVADHAGAPITYIPASAWSSAFSSLLNTDEIRRPLLGVRSADLAWARFDPSVSLEYPNRGVLLRDNRSLRLPAVTRGTPAASAGLLAGDVIQKVDRDILDGSADLGELLAEYRPGSNVTLTVLRGGDVIEIPVTLGSIETGEELK